MVGHPNDQVRMMASMSLDLLASCQPSSIEAALNDLRSGLNNYNRYIQGLSELKRRADNYSVQFECFVEIGEFGSETAGAYLFIGFALVFRNEYGKCVLRIWKNGTTIIPNCKWNFISSTSINCVLSLKRCPRPQ